MKYVFRVVPRLWQLRKKKRTRIFQNMRVPDIVTSVLQEAGIATRWQLTRTYPEREYCTQYEETDYHFVRRILAEAGIFFYFFGGGPVGGAVLAADAAVGAAGDLGSAAVGFVAGQSAGALVGAAAQMAETLIPGDSVVGADDAACYPPVAGDDPTALAASTAAAMAPAVGDALGAGSGVAGAAIGAASAVAGTVIADATAGAAPVMHFMANTGARVSTYDKITRFSLRNTVRSSAAAFRDYDLDRPMTLLQSVAVSTQPFPPSPLEAAAEAAAVAENAATTAATVLPGPAAGVLDIASSAVSTADAAVNDVSAALGQKVPFEVYEHHDPFLFPKWAFGRVPPGETQDLLARANWTQATADASYKVKLNNAATGAHDPVTTSCGDVLAAMLRLWNAAWIGAFNIRDTDEHNKKPGAKDKGWYVVATGSNTPKPGDILVLRNGEDARSAGSVGHVGILVSISDAAWSTADGGGGVLPDQEAAINTRPVRFDKNNVPILQSPTDKRWKLLDGWVDLEKIDRKGSQ